MITIIGAVSTAMIIGFPLMGLYLSATGIFVPNDEQSVVLQAMNYVSSGFYYAAQELITLGIEGEKFTCSDEDEETGNCNYRFGNELLDELGVLTQPIWQARNFFLVAMFSLALRYLAMMFLSFRLAYPRA
jgi:hypothetical protein